MSTSQSIPSGTIQRILEDERSHVRFEQFCCDLLTDAEGFQYLPTSSSWDLSRDGRSLPVTVTGTCAYACCTIGQDLTAKAETDILGLVSHAAPAAIRFCASAGASEHALQKIEDRLRDLVPSVPNISALGAIQLVTLSERHPASLQHRYAGELLEHADFLSQTTGDSLAPATWGFQVALATQFDDSAQGLRDHLVKLLVRRSLADGPLTVPAIAKRVSDALRLPRVIHREYFREALTSLVSEGYVAPNQGAYALTANGTSSLAADESDANRSLSRGKIVVRAAIEQLLGDTVEHAAFATLWAHLLDEFANLFFAQGLKFIQAISSLTRSGPNGAPSRPFGQMLEAMRARLARIGPGGARSESLAQAAIDVFSERGSDAVAWLTDVAAKYVSLCSLGLEPAAQQEIAGRLKDISLILDTDIVLSYLSEGERPHKVIEETVDRWREIGGPVLIAPPVLEETAHHAWISEYEYREVWRQLHEYSPDELPRYVKTAFVRAFYFAANGDYSLKRWSRFINEYRGHTAEDSGKISAILKDRGFSIVTAFEVDATFAASVRAEIYKIRQIPASAWVSKKTADKIQRDGDLVAYLRSSRENAPSQDHTTVIISSSPVLQRAASSFSEQLGETTPVWPAGALAYLVSLMPGVRLTLTHLRNCLFDEGESDSMDRVTQLAMRVIRQSTEYSIGYSQRPTLKRAIRHQIEKAARERGQSPAELVDSLADHKGETRQTLTEVLAGAIDEMQASKSERRIAELERQIRKLTGE